MKNSVIFSLIFSLLFIGITPIKAQADGWFVLGVLSRLATAPLPSGSSEVEEKKSDKMNKLLRSVEQQVSKSGKPLEITDLYEQLEINTNAVVLTFNSTYNGDKALTSIFFDAPKDDKAYMVGTSVWDDLAEYKMKTANLDYLKEKHKKYQTSFYKKNPSLAPTSVSVETTAQNESTEQLNKAETVK